MILRAKELEEKDGRRAYPIEDLQTTIKHFVSRVTTPDSPFGPHTHDGEEFWFILDGRAMVSLDGEEREVEAGDLIVIPSGKEHGLRTEGQARWLCFG